MRVVLLMVDSLRADAPGFAGGWCKTPTLDRMARESLCFRRCFSAAPWTVPSLAAMLTGAFAHRAGVYRWDQPLPPAFPSLFPLVRDLGYQAGSFVFDPNFLFSASPEASVLGSSQRLDDAIDWIERCASPNLFVFVHIWSTHFPYVEREMSASAWDRVASRVLDVMNANPVAGRAKARALYQRAVERFSERVIPRVLRAATMHEGSDGALVVLTGDHGESWGIDSPAEGRALHDVFDLHGNDLRDEVLAVPLLFWAPGRLPPSDHAEPVRTVDIAPTIMSVLGDPDALETEGELGIDGLSLVPDAKLTQSKRRPIVASQSYNLVTTKPELLPREPGAVWRRMSLRTEPWKYVWEPSTGAQWVHDLRADPGEFVHLDASAAPAAGWIELEAQWTRASCAPPPDVVETRLRRLGYLS